VENQTIFHQNLGDKYQVRYEKNPGVRTGHGFMVEVKGDDLEVVASQAKALYDKAKRAIASSVKAKK
jgi:NACalpha-BTF3-like transcription factor